MRGPTDFPAALSDTLPRAQLRQALVHLDLDAVGTSVGHANRYAAPGRLTTDQLDGCMRITAAAVQPLALTIASLDPTCERADRLLEPAMAAAVTIAERVIRSSPPSPP
jgi:arginase